MTLECVFLDFGHTLAHERESRASIYADVARSAGLETSTDEMALLMAAAHGELPHSSARSWRYSDAWFEAFIERIFVRDLGLGPGDCAAVTSTLFERFSSASTFALYPGALELLAGLKGAGLKLGVISNWSEHLADLLLDLGLAPWFDTLVVSAVERLEKPDRRIFELGLERLQIAPQRALHAGDRLREDCLGARSAGLRAVLVEHAGESSEPHGFPCVNSLLGLRDHILSILS